MDKNTTYEDIKKLPIPRKDQWSYRYYSCGVSTVLWPDSSNQVMIEWNLPKMAEFCQKKLDNNEEDLHTLPLRIPATAKIEHLEWRSELTECDEPDNCEISHLSDNWRIDGLKLGNSLEAIAQKYGDDISFYPFTSEEGGGICCEKGKFPKTLTIELIDHDNIDKRDIYSDVAGSRLPKNIQTLKYSSLPSNIQKELSVYAFTVYMHPQPKSD